MPWSTIHTHDAAWCRYCHTNHPTRAHHDPRDARAMVERMNAEGNFVGAAFWNAVVRKLTRGDTLS
jgi:hypothetical protein